MTWKSDLRTVLATLFGLLNALAGGFFLYKEMSVPPSHSMHVYLFAGWVAIGCLIMAPSLMIGAAKQVVVFLPDIRFGGQRYNDPPAPPAGGVVPPDQKDGNG